MPFKSFHKYNHSEATTNLGHLRVRKVLVDDDALDEHGVLHPAAHFALDLDQLKVDVLSLDVGNREDGVDCDFGHHSVTLVHAKKENGMRERAPTCTSFNSIDG